VYRTEQESFGATEHLVARCAKKLSRGSHSKGSQASELVD